MGKREAKEMVFCHSNRCSLVIGTLSDSKSNVFIIGGINMGKKSKESREVYDKMAGVYYRIT